MRSNNQKSHDVPKKSRFADEIGERCGEIEYRGDEVLHQWRGLGCSVLLSVY